jgi:alanine racemase
MVYEPELVALRRSWVEIDVPALEHNLRSLRALNPTALLAPVVKSNAYGHGILLAARAFLDAGADWLCVDSLHEAWQLRAAGIKRPLFVLGYVPVEHAEALVELECRTVLYSEALLRAIATAASRRGRELGLHFKLETGTNRQGLRLETALALAQLARGLEGVRVEGICTHFANVEDTTDHRFAEAQLARFAEAAQAFEGAGFDKLLRSISNSAASILWPQAHFELLRPGIASYGMWPSKETFLSAVLAGRHEIELRPALRWLTQIAQIKTVPVGESVGYGCTFRATHDTRIGILPVGYYDGYDRSLSGLAHVLVRGQRAQLRGRICMNMMMIDLTDIPDAREADPVVLLGTDGKEQVSAEQLGEWSGTINYEVTTRINDAIPRLAMPST